VSCEADKGAERCVKGLLEADEFFLLSLAKPDAERAALCASLGEQYVTADLGGIAQLPNRVGLCIPLECGDGELVGALGFLLAHAHLFGFAAVPLAVSAQELAAVTFMRFDAQKRSGDEV
jgi:hypothetical protein